MPTYWEVKVKSLQLLQAMTIERFYEGIDQDGHPRYRSGYSAGTWLELELQIPPDLISANGPDIREAVCSMFAKRNQPTNAKLRSIVTVGDFVKLLCKTGGISVPDREPT
jgi:hypothetical protein